MTLARTQVQPAPVYFAEKHMWPNYIPVLTWELYPRAKEVFLVRDFRDMARSIMAFDERRGFAGFGRPEGASDEEYMRGELRQMAARPAAELAHQGRPGAPGALRGPRPRPAETVTAMLEYLELDASPETVQEVLATGSEQVLRLPGSGYEEAEVQAHRTRRRPARDDRPLAKRERRVLSELAKEVFGEALKEFGYEV